MSNPMDNFTNNSFMQALQSAQSAQNAYLVNQLRPTAVPAYITCSPYESVYGYNRNGCCCGPC